jgi:hypothetical protein
VIARRQRKHEKPQSWSITLLRGNGNAEGVKLTMSSWFLFLCFLLVKIVFGLGRIFVLKFFCLFSLILLLGFVRFRVTRGHCSGCCPTFERMEDNLQETKEENKTVKGESYRKQQCFKPAPPQARARTRCDSFGGRYPVQRSPSSCCAGPHQTQAAA